MAIDNLKLIFDHKNNTAKLATSKFKESGLLGYNKQNKTFSCDASDMSCMGINNVPPMFDLMVEESGNVKTFRMIKTKRDAESEIQYWEFEAIDDSTFKFLVFND